MDEYNWDDFDAATQEYLNSYYPDLVSPNYTLSDADYRSLTSPISNQELSNFYRGLFGPMTDLSYSLPSFGQQLDLGAAYQPTLTVFASPENFEKSIAQLTNDSYLARKLADEYASEQKAEEDLLNRGSMLAGLYSSGIYADELPEGAVVNPLFDRSREDSPFVTTSTGDTYIRNPEGKYVGWVGDGDSANFYDQIPGYVDPDSLEGQLTRLSGQVVGGLKKFFERPAAQAAAKAAQGTTITRNPDGSITIGGAGGGQQQRQPSAAESVAKMAGLLYQLTKKDKTPVKARESTVQNIGPQYQAARPVRTLYAKGGKVELPESVGGGLLPIAMKIAEMLISQSGGEEEMPHRKGLIGGEESGQEDNVEAMLSPGEYVIDAEIVSALGDGNTDAGAKKLDEMRYNIRKHKRNGGLAQIAPKAKSPEKYMKG